MMIEYWVFVEEIVEVRLIIHPLSIIYYPTPKTTTKNIKNIKHSSLPKTLHEATLTPQPQKASQSHSYRPTWLLPANLQEYHLDATGGHCCWSEI